MFYKHSYAHGLRQLAMFAGCLERTQNLRTLAPATADGQLGAAGWVGRRWLDQGLEQALEFSSPTLVAAAACVEK